jgi:hypothetical protein
MTAAAVHSQATPGGDITVSAAEHRFPVARITEGRLRPAAPCVPIGGPLEPLAPQSVLAPIPVAQARTVALGSEEWNQLSPLVLALAERREREQRLVPATTSRAPRFLDWLFASEAGGASVYYFEASRRVPSVAAPIDVDVDTDPPGTIRIVVSGFVRRDPAGLAPLGTKGELRWEQDDLPRGPSRPDLRPLGILALPDDPVWVMETRTPMSVWVNFFAVGTRGTTLRVSTRLGTC